MCSARRFSPMLFQREPGEDLIFPRRPSELILAPATSCTWLAVASSWHRLWMWYYEALFTQRSLIHRENLCLAVGFLCPQQFLQGVRSLVLLHFYSCWVDSQVCMYTQICVYERERVGRSSCPGVLLCTACQKVEPDALSDDDRQPKALWLQRGEREEK